MGGAFWHVSMEVHMPRLGRPKKLLVLTDEERETLERWARRPKTPAVPFIAIEDRAGLCRGAD